jgi:hypothetical protein
MVLGNSRTHVCVESMVGTMLHSELGTGIWSYDHDLCICGFYLRSIICLAISTDDYKNQNDPKLKNVVTYRDA